MALIEERFPIEGLDCEDCAGPIICEVLKMDDVDSVEFDFTIEPPQLVIASLRQISVEEISGVLQAAVERNYSVGEM